MDVKSISALWHTDMWLLYTVFVASNGILFMIGDNKIINKIAGLLLILMLIFPVGALESAPPSEWGLGSWLHHIFASSFFIVKALNHREYDYALIAIGAITLLSAGLSLYATEFIGLYTLAYTGYLKKKNYFRKYRTYVTRRNKLEGDAGRLRGENQMEREEHPRI